MLRSEQRGVEDHKTHSLSPWRETEFLSKALIQLGPHVYLPKWEQPEKGMGCVDMTQGPVSLPS